VTPTQQGGDELLIKARIARPRIGKRAKSSHEKGFLLLEKTADIFAFANSFSSNADQFHGGMINTMEYYCAMPHRKS
jgi:hypothetical protein